MGSVDESKVNEQKKGRMYASTDTAIVISELKQKTESFFRKPLYIIANFNVKHAARKMATIVFSTRALYFVLSLLRSIFKKL